ncbi:Aspartic proteinase 36 [Orobanche minor]
MRLYLTKVKLGFPPREFIVQIDTGCDILWVTCNPFEDCPWYYLRHQPKQ